MFLAGESIVSCALVFLADFRRDLRASALRVFLAGEFISRAFALLLGGTLSGDAAFSSSSVALYFVAGVDEAAPFLLSCPTVSFFGGGFFSYLVNLFENMEITKLQVSSPWAGIRTREQ